MKKQDKNAVSIIIRTSSRGEEPIVERIPKTYVKAYQLFLTFPHCPVEAEVVGRIVNCGVGYGLDIHV